MKVYLYTFQKKENSTIRPSEAGAEYECILKADCSTTDPEIELDIGLLNSPADYNYAYIPEFSRYYFISSWKWVRNRLWSAVMNCDVLATWKELLGAQTFYMLRASAEYDGAIQDTYYPAKTDCTFDISPFTDYPWSGENGEPDVRNGCYILGCTAAAGGLLGSINYYALNYENMLTLTGKLLAVVNADNGFDVNDASFALQKAIVDPMQYIKSCIWVPVSYESIDGTAVANIEIANFTLTGCSGKYLLNSSGKRIITARKLITTNDYANHPQAAARGSYLNFAPYTVRNLFLPPFGIIPLDLSVVGNGIGISCDIIIDLISGKGILNVSAVVGANTYRLNRLSSMVGVSIQLSQITQNLLGSGFSALGVVGSAIQGNIIGAAEGIVSAITSQVPREQSIGGNGGFSDLYRQPGIYSQFYSLAEENQEEHGRPLMKLRKPASLGGYMICADADVKLPAPSQEISAVRSYMEGGFYYE